MNMKLLATGVALGLMSSTAQAVSLNPDGLGEVLFYPYYTVNGGNDTLISLVNSTDNAKAVKVRFMEGKNSREVLDFNLYLSAKDVWVAAVTLKDGVPTLVVRDTSCTTPYLYDQTYQEFLPYAMDDQTDLSRMNEGHIEVIEMGTVVGESAVAATHVVSDASIDGVPFPADCQALNDAWTDFGDGTVGYWLEDPHTDMEAPSGGLYGGASVVNVSTGTMYSFEAKGINGFATEVGELHQVPGTVLPSLNSGDVKVANVFLDNGDVLTSPEFDRGVDAISWVFMHDNLMNEYTVDPVLDSTTDWIITFPTKSFYVDPQVTGSETALAPFTSVWQDLKACETLVVDSVFGREEETVAEEPPTTRPPVVSPSLPPTPGEIEGFELCFETNIIQFSERGIFGSPNAVLVDPASAGFTNGWANFDMTFDLVGNEYVKRPDLGGLMGLPVVGFSAFEYINNFVDNEGIRANYSGLFQHKATRAVADQ